MCLARCKGQAHDLSENMNSVEESVMASLDGEDAELYPFMPYLLQDLWEIGASPEVMRQLITKHRLQERGVSRILDLGCGKGAISVPLASEFGFQVHGIDALPDFIEEARYWAEHYNVSPLCRFEVGDVRKRITQLREYDLAILGSIGPVFGPVEATVMQVSGALKPGGYILLDDGYLPDDSPGRDPIYDTRSEALRQIQRTGVEIVEEHIIERDMIEEADADIYQAIEQRAHELIAQHPAQRHLFEAYLHRQAEENERLETEIICVTWVLKTPDKVTTNNTF